MIGHLGDLSKSRATCIMAAGAQNMRERIIVVAAATLLSASEAVRASTIALWCFDDGIPGHVAAGNGTVLDCSGLGHAGTPVGFPRYCAATTASNDIWLRLDGQVDRVFVPDAEAFELTGSLTLEAWIRVDSIPPQNVSSGGQIVFRGDDLGAKDPYFLALDLAGRPTFHVESLVAGSNVSALTPLPLGVISHVAGTLDDATGLQRLYVDGVLVASALTAVRPFATLTGPSPGLGIGALQGTFEPQHLDGAIGAVRISDAALPPEQFLGIASITARPEDLNADCLVDGGDVGVMLAQWGPVTPGSLADLDRNGMVNGSDLGLLLSAWD